MKKNRKSSKFKGSSGIWSNYPGSRVFEKLTRIGVSFALIAASFQTLKAQTWSTNPAVNSAISTATNHQQNPTIVSDGAGGAIITWFDYRSGTNHDIYAQRINASGAVQWTANGVVICSASGDQQYPTIVSDGAGGAIITWWDYRSGTNYDVYTQRINASGAVQWTTDGVAICTETSLQQYPTIVSDGAAGAIITWMDLRSGWDIYAQRINASGAVQWTANGVAICNATNNQQYPNIATDGSGGAIITWQDLRSGGWDIYAQRINASGAAQWTANGVAISTATNNQQFPIIVSDGAGGAIVTWWDPRSGGWDIYAQRINTSGAVQWTTDGVAISTASGNQNSPTMVSDGAAGAIITWLDNRSTTRSDVYAQRINASGAVQWTTDGVAISTATTYQYSPNIATDGAAGAIITWWDSRSGSTYDSYAQHINASGAVQWTANGIAVGNASGDQRFPTIVSDGTGKAIITWQDSRSGSWDIYAQNINPNGSLGPCALSSCTITVTPTNGTYTGGVNTNLYIGYPSNNPSATLTTAGGTATIWSPSTYLSCTNCSSTVFTPTAAGTYTISGTNCFGTCTVTICVKDIRVPNTSGAKAAVYICHLEPFGTKPQTLATISRGISAHLAYHKGDKLGVCGNTCNSKKRDFEIADLVIDEQYLEVMCTPNPFRQSFKLNYVSHLDIEATISIYGMTGNLMETTTLNGVANEAELGNNLPNGIYTVSFNQGDTKKVFRMIKID